MDQVTYSNARERFAELWDRVLAERDAIRLTRRGRRPVVLLGADEYEGLLETAHLLRSPENASRLLSALESAQAGNGEAKRLTELRSDFEGAEKTGS